MQPSDFLPTFDLSSGSPCFRPTSAADASSWPGFASIRFRVPVGDLVTGSPASRTDSSRSEQDLPGYWAVLFLRAPVNHPARCAISSPLSLAVMALLPSEMIAPWAPGISYSFRGRIPAAHTFVDLRIAVTVTRNGARPYFRPAGLSFGRVGFAPTGRLTEFQLVSPPPFHSDQPCLVASIIRHYSTTVGGLR